MPAWDEEIEDAAALGVEFHYLAAPVRIAGEAGRARCLTAVRMELGEADASGRRRPIPLPDSEFNLTVDTVIPAIGQTPDLDLLTNLDLQVNRRGRIVVEPKNQMTSRTGVFAAGDAVYGPRTVVEAVAAGNQTAAGIHRYLNAVPDETTARFEIAANGVGTGDEGPPTKGMEENSAPPMPAASLPPLTAVQRQSIPRTAMPVLPVPARKNEFAEVALGFSESKALSEAARCLSCGPCSECLACEKVCAAAAIRHDQEPTRLDLEVAAILVADDSEPPAGLQFSNPQWLVRTAPDDVLGASAAAGQIMARFPVGPFGAEVETARQASESDSKIGVFICECGQAIGDILDMEAIRDRAGRLPDVGAVRILPISCTPEAADDIRHLAAGQRLTQVVLAACSCCALDQACHSCTYQRIRCKKNFHVQDRHSVRGERSESSGSRAPDVPVEFVNIRETCAWAHAGDPQSASEKALSVISAAVAKCRHRSFRTLRPQPHHPSVLIVGGGRAGEFCLDILRRRQIAVHRVLDPPQDIRRTGGRYQTRFDGRKWETDAVVLAPKDAHETQRLMGAFGPAAQRPRLHSCREGISTHRPGVFFCDPSSEHRVVGCAAAARVCAWTGGGHRIDRSTVAVVTPHRCRACRTCVDICEFGAPEIKGGQPFRSAWIDPRICQGCGTCAAHCPSGAITAGDHSDEQLAAMLESDRAAGP
jgi:heterodisulfide reductase subunit A-like polyferredoxin